MSIWSRIKAAITVPQALHPTRNPIYWGISNATKVAGQTVTETSAMGSAPYYACIRNLAEDISTLPVHVYRRLPQGGKQLDTSHQVSYVLQVKPNPLMTPFTFRSAMMANVAGNGNAYAEIVRDGRGRVAELWPIHPSRVRWELVGNTLTYYVHGSVDGRTVATPIPSADLLHYRGLTVDGLAGLSVAQMAAATIGVALAEQEFSANFLANGASLSGVLVHPGNLSDDAASRLRQSWAEVYGGTANAGKPALLEEGMEWKPLGVPQKDAQFLQSREFSISEICRWFRMPPHKIMHLVDATYSNIESQDRQYVNDTLMPWLVRIEQELTAKLFTDAEIRQGMMISHKADSRLRGDSAARAQYLVAMTNMGAMTPNEVREYEGLNPAGPEADELYIQLNMTTLKNINAPEPEPDPEPEPAPEEPETEDGEDDPMAIWVESITARVCRKAEKALGRPRLTEEDQKAFASSQLQYLVQELAPVCKAFHGKFSGDPATLTRMACSADPTELTRYLITYWRPDNA